MSELGQLLKKARTQKGYTLDEIQDMTKIRKRYLEAIEEGNYKVLPGNFYVRAFIKSYAEAVGLEPDEVLRLYRNVIPEAAPEPISEPIRRRRRTPKNTEKLSKWAAALLAIAFPLLIVGIIYYYSNLNAEGRPPLSDPPPLTENNALPEGEPAPIGTGSGSAEPEIEPEPEPEPPKPTLTLEKSEGNTDFYHIAGAEQLVVEVTVVGDTCWMAVQKDNAKGEYVEKNLTLKNGDSRTWTFDGSAYFNFGKASAVRVKINDQEVHLGELANPRKLQLNLAPGPDGTKPE